MSRYLIGPFNSIKSTWTVVYHFLLNRRRPRGHRLLIWKLSIHWRLRTKLLVFRSWNTFRLIINVGTNVRTTHGYVSSYRSHLQGSSSITFFVYYIGSGLLFLELTLRKWCVNYTCSVRVVGSPPLFKISPKFCVRWSSPKSKLLFDFTVSYRKRRYLQIFLVLAKMMAQKPQD